MHNTRYHYYRRDDPRMGRKCKQHLYGAAETYYLNLCALSMPHEIDKLLSSKIGFFDAHHVYGTSLGPGSWSALTHAQSLRYTVLMSDQPHRVSVSLGTYVPSHYCKTCR